jgi:hypothetical protein
MKVAAANIEEIRARLGDDATTDDARTMLDALRDAGITDTDDVSEREWLRLAARFFNGWAE